MHGDLNGANILIDPRDNVWVIDYFHTDRGHVLNDLLKLENDLLYIFTPLADAQELAQALRITRALLEVDDLGAPLPATLPGLRTEALKRAWATLRTLRAIGAELVRQDRNPQQTLIGLLRYSVHTLSFVEPDTLQKRWALAASCLMAERIAAQTEENRELRVDWIDPAALAARGRLGMTICPGRRDHGRELETDLEVLREQGVERIYGLLTEEELEWAGVPGIAEACESRSMRYTHLPVPDQGVPSPEEALALCAEIGQALDAGEDVVVHCVGGLGRTGTLAACVAVHRGLSADEAIATVREARGPRAIESEAQVRFIHAFEGGD